MNILHQVLSYVKHQFSPGAKSPRPAIQALTLDEALSRSLAFGLNSVDWKAVR